MQPGAKRTQEETPTVFPFARGWVDNAEQFVVGDRLRIQIDCHWLLLHDLVRLEQRLPHHALAGARVAHNEHRVTHIEQLLQLHHLH